ncbi:hypothetical protein H2203_001959 [Taxawa tesnikishii (nom. ined.)]|nr:hypothetical protein H2203_001959 [Dothideales sp. JES 119]
MAQFHPPDLSVLKDKVVVITGGALGIGSQLVRLCHSHGAHVFFGDVLTEPAEKLVEELSVSAADSASGPAPKIYFVRTDVSDYQDNLKLFDTAYQTCGRIDHAVSAAGMPKESLKVMDINLLGPLYFARIASVYLRQPALNDKASTNQADKSLTLVSSIAGFTEAPGLFVYSTAKHGVYGLMRALRGVLIKSSPQAIRTNAICPWMTETRLVSGIEDAWHKAGLPRNTPMDVAKIIGGVMADPKLNGGALLVEGGRAWEVEQGIDRTQPQWMGERLSADF